MVIELLTSPFLQVLWEFLINRRNFTKINRLDKKSGDNEHKCNGDHSFAVSVFGGIRTKNLIRLIECNLNINLMSINSMTQFDQVRVSIHKKLTF